MNSRIFAIAALSIFIASCEKEVIIDVPPHQPKLVILSETYNDDTLRVSVSKSIDVLKYKMGADLSVNNAVVMLQPKGMPALRMNYNELTGHYIADAVATPGTEYQIKVSAAGYGDAVAVAKTPDKILIKSLLRIKDVRLDVSGIKQDEIRLTFDDNGSEKNYYLIWLNAGYVSDSFENYTGVSCVNTSDPSVESIYDESINQNTCIESNGIFLRDDLFNGKTKELRLFVNSDALQPVHIPGIGEVYPTIELLHVSEDHFKYLKSYRFASYNAGNPFAEPTNIYTNVQNGYGIFSIIQSDVAEIK